MFRKVWCRERILRLQDTAFACSHLPRSVTSGVVKAAVTSLLEKFTASACSLHGSSQED